MQSKIFFKYCNGEVVVDALKIVMKRRRTHTGHIRKRLNVERLFTLLMYPIYRSLN